MSRFLDQARQAPEAVDPSPTIDAVTESTLKAATKEGWFKRLDDILGGLTRAAADPAVNDSQFIKLMEDASREISANHKLIDVSAMQTALEDAMNLSTRLGRFAKRFELMQKATQ